MRFRTNVLTAFFAATALMAVGAIHYMAPSAFAQSGYYTSMGCAGCHTATSTCNGCHAHGTHPSSAKSSINVTGTTNKTSYAPGETVTVTINGGYRTGWLRAVVYNQSGAEIARTSGNASGMGSSGTYPVTLTAPAPSTPGSYTWKVGWYGNQFDTGSAAFGSGWTPDPTNPEHGYEVVSMSPFTVAAPADTTAPVVNTFTLPSTSTSLTVPVTALAATDNVAVTGYMVTTSSTAPLASAAGWSASPPTSVTAAAAGSVTYFAWAKDAAGNVSASRSASVNITLPDTTAPVVNTFTLPATSTSLTVPVTALSASDNVAVTGYMVTTTSATPAASASGWSGSAPTSVTAPAPGTVTFFAWAKDAAGNVSGGRGATVVITLPDTTAPVVNTFTLPATGTSLTVSVTALSASDNVAVTGYMVTTSSTAPLASAAGWTAAAPVSVTAPAAGSVTFFAWAKDAAGNVSASRSASVNITLPDTTAPVVNTFTLPVNVTNLTVPVTALNATDNVAVTGYMITTTITAPAASAAGWTATAPASVAAPSAGSITFYAWAKDAAGNVSASKNATVNITLPDTTAPVVNTFTLPATSTSLTVSVTALSATDNIAVTGYMVTTSSAAPASSAAGWAATPPASVTAPAEGSVTFFAWAKDAAGNVSLSKSATVVITTTTADTTNPALTVSALADGAYTNKPTLNVTGTATDDGGLKSVSVNGQVVSVDAGGNFSTAINLNVGANIITVVAIDNAGNQSSDSRTVNFDPNAPLLSVSEPADNSISVQSFLTVSGTLDEAATVTVRVNNGSPQSASINGNTFSAVANLVSGVNTIEIIATDLAGNQSSAKRTVTYEGTGFTLAITYPKQDITTTKSSIVLTGKIADATSGVKVTITMDGRTYTPRVYEGSFKQRLTFTQPKLYAITVTATDQSGNSSSVVRNVIYKSSRNYESDDVRRSYDREDDD